MNEKQQQLTFEKGITNVPSDLLCSDNALEESVGMIHDDGEHRVIQKPVTFVDSETPIAPIIEGFHLLYVHKFNAEERYIGYTYDTAYHANYLCYATKDGTELTYRELEAPYTETTKVTSIGKTLIVSSIEHIYYFAWQTTIIEDVHTPTYKNLGGIPEAEFDFWLESERIKPVQTLKGLEEVFQASSGKALAVDISDSTRAVEDIEAYTDSLMGNYAKNKKNIAKKKLFSNPFFIRYAFEMYDGTYTHISQPILMMPCVSSNTFMILISGVWFNLYTSYAKLCFKQTKDLSDWKDIIKKIAIFVSDSIEIYETHNDASISLISGPAQYCKMDGIFWDIYNTETESKYNTKTIHVDLDEHSTVYQSYEPLAKRNEKDILNDIHSTSIFYKLCNIGTEAFTKRTEIAQFINDDVMENLNAQEWIEDDDWFSRSSLNPNFIYAYNSRLNLANVSRSLFEGYDFFMPFDNSTASTYDFYVRIKTDTESVWVRHQVSTKQKQGIYFYYPDSRADRVTIYKGNTCVCDKELTEHPGLNGAYYLKGLPGVDVDEETVSVDPIEGFDPNRTMPDINNKYNNDYQERLPNYIIQSDVNNPWVFPAKGYHKVGTGKIIGMSTLTQALSQGQFGQYPLLVFSESGIWAMSVNNTGLFQAIHPMSREVCNNPDSITQTDGAVFFSSEKGLMVVVGSDVKCVSEQLSGLESDFEGEVKMGNFRDYMKDCFIAYDYRDSLLWIFNNSRQQNQGYCYVYAIKGGTFGKYRFEQPIENVVNNYPDYLLQSGSTLFSLTGRQNINLDTSAYSGLIITRPMKLENGLALKSLMQVRHILQMKGRMTLRIYVSNNLNHWAEVHSLRGTPWKYYRFRFDFSDMKATDRFAGSMVITQERRTDKLL